MIPVSPGATHSTSAKYRHRSSEAGFTRMTITSRPFQGSTTIQGGTTKIGKFILKVAVAKLCQMATFCQDYH